MVRGWKIFHCRSERKIWNVQRTSRKGWLRKPPVRATLTSLIRRDPCYRKPSPELTPRRARIALIRDAGQKRSSPRPGKYYPRLQKFALANFLSLLETCRQLWTFLFKASGAIVTPITCQMEALTSTHKERQIAPQFLASYTNSRTLPHFSNRTTCFSKLASALEKILLLLGKWETTNRLGFVNKWKQISSRLAAQWAEPFRRDDVATRVSREREKEHLSILMGLGNGKSECQQSHVGTIANVS